MEKGLGEGGNRADAGSVCVTKYLAGKKSFSPKESRGDAGITSFFLARGFPKFSTRRTTEKIFPAKKGTEEVSVGVRIAQTLSKRPEEGWTEWRGGEVV